MKKKSVKRRVAKTPSARTRGGFPRFADLPDTYAALCELHLPRPIHTAADARRAAAVIESMAGFPLNREQEDYLEVVARFADEYDRARAQPLIVEDARTVLIQFLDEYKMTAAYLSRLLGGNRNLGALILRGERNLTRGQIRNLATFFNVNEDVFI